jgi:hypothetical protein
MNIIKWQLCSERLQAGFGNKKTVTYKYQFNCLEQSNVILIDEI